MTPTRDDYNYRRAAKSARNIARILNSATAPESPDADTLEMLRKQWNQDERETILLCTAPAERIIRMRPYERNCPTEADPTAVLRNNLGVKYLDHDFAKAIRNFQAAVRSDPGFALAHNNLGLTAIEIGDTTRAIKLLKYAVTLDPNLDIAHGNFGFAYLEQGLFAFAYESFAMARRLDPDEPMHFNNQGILYLAIKAPQIALERFNRAIQLDPGNPMYYANRAIAWQELSEYQYADTDFQEAAAIEEHLYNTALEGAA